MAGQPEGVSIATPAGMARMNKWLNSEKERHVAPHRWAEKVLFVGGLPADPAAYIAADAGGKRQAPAESSSHSPEAPWFRALTEAIDEAGHPRGSREHLAAALLVALAFEASFVHARRAAEAAEAAFRAGALWEAARRDDDADLGRKVLKLRTGPSELTRTNLASAVAGFARRASLAIEADQWARLTLDDAGLPACAARCEPDGQGGLRQASSEQASDAPWWAPLPKAVLKGGHARGSQAHRAAETSWWLAEASAAIAAGKPEEAARSGFKAGEAREAAITDPHATVGRHRRSYTGKGGRRKGDEEEHGRWWLAHRRLRRLFPRDRFPEASDRELARVVAKHFGADPDAVRIAVARMSAWKRDR